MALVTTRAMPPLAVGTYLRIDGIRFEAAPQLRADGIWSVDPTIPVRFHVYAYQSSASRKAGDAPIADAAHEASLGSLALLDVVPGTSNMRLGPAWRMRDNIDTAQLWCALYQHLRLTYSASVNE